MTETAVSPAPQPRPTATAPAKPRDGPTAAPSRSRTPGGRLRALDGLRLPAALMVAGALTHPFHPVHEHLGRMVVHAPHRGLGIGSAETFGLTIAAMLLPARPLNRYLEDVLTPKIRTRLSRPSPKPLSKAA
ncbi:hypothetical protein [Streptomyces sp. TE5632]